MSFFHSCFSHILLVKPSTWFFHKWNIGFKWVKFECLNQIQKSKPKDIYVFAYVKKVKI